MKTHVIDTNVAVAANGRDTHANKACQLACMDALVLVATQKVAIDDRGLILKEYGNRLNYAGRPGVGDFFSSMFSTISIGPTAYAELPFHRQTTTSAASASFRPTSWTDPTASSSQLRRR